VYWPSTFPTAVTSASSRSASPPLDGLVPTRRRCSPKGIRPLILLVDTGVLLAAADRSDPAHEASRELLESHPGPPITTELALVETGWLLDGQLGPPAEAALCRSVGDCEMVVTFREAIGDGSPELTERYADQHLGDADADLVTLAEQLGITTIAILDQRHFSVVRPKHAKVLNLVPRRSMRLRLAVEIRPFAVASAVCESTTTGTSDHTVACRPEHQRQVSSPSLPSSSTPLAARQSPALRPTRPTIDFAPLSDSGARASPRATPPLSPLRSPAHTRPDDPFS